MGVTGLYDATDGFRRMGEIPSHGVGPHEVLLLRDGRTLVVANGGILTHPDYPRQKLNLPTMRASLAYCDITSGTLVDKVELATELRSLSIRHLAVDKQGDVWFGCQHEGDVDEQPPLVGRHRRGREPELFAGPPDLLRSMRGYVGSVAVDTSGTVLATSSPVGGLVAFWDTATGRSLGSRSLADGCGVAPLRSGRIMATSGHGVIVEAGPETPDVVTLARSGRVGWDNHLRRIDPV